jgi:hypothetical protein
MGNDAVRLDRAQAKAERVAVLACNERRIMNLWKRPAIESALLGWMSIGSPERLRPEMESDQLSPVGE